LLPAQAPTAWRWARAESSASTATLSPAYDGGRIRAMLELTRSVEPVVEGNTHRAQRAASITSAGGHRLSGARSRPCTTAAENAQHFDE